ncbi:MAG TPA: choice-of-anchor A family protein [Candidatus Sulfotelmatobacter sp.]|nr:choice-of-anchor A family protein [Candidatus Sulfotelmatobacter sp.]
MQTLDTILGTYNVYLSGNMGSAANPYTSDSQGPMAIGGNAYLRSFSTASNTTNGVAALTVGGNLTEQSGTINGNAFVGGTASFPTSFGGTTIKGSLNAAGGIGTAPTQVTGGTHTGSSVTLPLPFSAVSSDLAVASQLLASETPTAGDSVQIVNGNQIKLNANAAGINYFTLTAAELANLGSASFTINAAHAGETIIINVDDSGAVTFGAPGNFGFTLNGVSAENVLFNLANASSVTMSSMSLQGSLLAPDATVNFTNGNIVGSLIADNLNSVTYQDGEFEDGLFDGTLPILPTGDSTSVPEPSSFALFGGALALLALGMRSRRLRTARPIV